MHSLDCPWPSTIAGLVRTRIGTDGTGKFNLTVEEARRIAVRGPLLAQLNRDGSVEEYLLPAPRDCTWHWLGDRRDQIERRRLTPQRAPAGCETDLGHQQLVGFTGETPRGKAVFGPMFWRWKDLRQWLLAPPLPGKVEKLAAAFGHGPFIHERRTHVAIDPGTQTVSEGQLFSTDGLRFTAREERLAITFVCEDGRLEGGGAQCGGERRLSFLRKGRDIWPSYPQELEVATDRLARVVLLTPAIFGQGFTPTEVKGARVVACAVPRAEVISGWDLEHNGPKATRRMAPAGSVYWVQLAQGLDARRWAMEVWMQCISDAEQDRLDGFGLCVVGVA